MPHKRPKPAPPAPDATTKEQAQNGAENEALQAAGDSPTVTASRAITAVTPAPAPPRRQGQWLSDEQRAAAQAQFLELFRLSANVTRSAQRAGVERKTVYYWLDNDPAFAERYHEAEEEACDVIRAVITDRAVTGWKEPLVSMGRVVTDAQGRPMQVHKYDSQLLGKLAQARLPEWGPKPQQTVQVNTQVNQISIESQDARADLLARLTRLADSVRESRVIDATE